MSSSDEQPEQTTVRVNIELPGDLDAIYSNFAVITHSPSEMVIDFARMLPNNPKAKVHARIIMTPMSAKLLLHALAENLEGYEKQYGEVKTPAQSFSAHGPIGFGKK